MTLLWLMTRSLSLQRFTRSSVEATDPELVVTPAIWATAEYSKSP